MTPPITYSIIEDAVAVDGGGGKKYRAAFLLRYNASPKFRMLLRQMTWFWGVPSLAVGVALMALVFTVPRPVAYGLGWSIPSFWAGLWTLITIFWVKRALREEEREWKGPVWAENMIDAGAGEEGSAAEVEMRQGNGEPAPTTANV